jgi:hypothetical protein
MKPDIVYVLKKSDTNEEFRYSLRSLDKNCTNYGKVITIGGHVDGIKPDIEIILPQSGRTKYDKVNFTLKEICLNKQISDDFILMNDDFFIMKPLDMSKLKSHYRCSMEEYLQLIVNNKCPSEYTGRLARTAAALNVLELTDKCYELHIPMLFNKHKLLEVFGVFTGFCGTRSLYGNYHKVGGSKINDCKVFTCGEDFVKNTNFLSTTDKSFRLGAVGEYIRSQFPKKSRFED